MKNQFFICKWNSSTLKTYKAESAAWTTTNQDIA